MLRRTTTTLALLLAAGLFLAAATQAYRTPTEPELEGITRATEEIGNEIGFSLHDVRVSDDGEWATATIHPDLPPSQAQDAKGVYRLVSPTQWKLELLSNEVCFGRVLANKGMFKGTSESLGIPPCSRYAAPPRNPARVLIRRSICDETFVYRPHRIGLSCDGTFLIQRIRWLHYGGQAASARASAYTRGCNPACAVGRVFHPTARIRLSHRVRCDGREIYARLRFTLRGPIPEGFRHHGTYSLLPTDEGGEPSR